jgi:hypothetical protein
MANVLSKAGISNSLTVEAWHVSQSVDAFTGLSAYDITISGSLRVTGSTSIIGAITSSGAISSSAGLLGTTLITTGDSYINQLTIGKGGGNQSSNTALGGGALTSNATGTGNTAIGSSSLRDNTTGASNTAVGTGAMEKNITGNFNTAVGLYSLDANTAGNQNTAVGLFALQSNEANNNTAVGYFALYANTTGIDNTAVGKSAGGTSTSYNSVFLGANTRANADNETNQIVIGEGAIGSGSNSATLGNTSITTTILRGNIQITSSANAILTLTPITSWPPSPNPPSGSLAVSGSGNAMRLMLWNGGSWTAQA